MLIFRGVAMNWNNNGHRDNFDDLMDLHLFNEISSKPTGKDSSGCLTFVIASVIVFLVFGLIGSSCNKNKHTSSYRSNYPTHTYTTRTYTTTPHTTYSNYNSYKTPAKSYSQDYDEYNTKDYSDAEDFYDNHYDDFDDFEDAEDYFDDYGD